jgi:glycerophosphoryl diester phosphodiesterase
MPALEAAVRDGAEAVEIDITVTKDNQIVLWHDYEPGGVVATMREMGIEPTMGYKPLWPPQGHPARRPIHELNLVSVQANYGYSARDGNIFTNERVNVDVPTFDQVAAYLKRHPEVKEVVLDVKLPPDRPDVQRRFAERLKTVIEANGLAGRVVLMHNDAGVIRNLKQATGNRYPATHDVEIVSLAPDADDYSAVDSARRLGNKVASVGRPRLGIDGYATYLDVLRRDRAKINASNGEPRKLVAWTINDELEMREIMAIGVNGIVTDDPKLLAKLNRVYFNR